MRWIIKKAQSLIFILFSLTLLLICHAAVLSAATITLPVTGQSSCYNTSGSEITCAATGQDGEKNRGVVWPEPRFTLSGDCVIDNLTGLVWTKNANLPKAVKNWQQALDYVASLNSSGLGCGYTDWRLPQVLELESLVHAGYSKETCGTAACLTNADWLESKGFTNVQKDYWSSSTTADSAYGAWYVNISSGAMGGYYKDTNVYVWPVRTSVAAAGVVPSAAPAEVWKTGQKKCYQGILPYTEISCTDTRQDGDTMAGVAWPSPRFSDNNNGTVTDNLTGLVWLLNADCFGLKSLQESLSASVGLASGQCGLSDSSQPGDWRMPNRKELLSLVDYSRSYPALPANYPFTNVHSRSYWSSSTYAPITSYEWNINLSYGYLYNGYKDSSNYLWPVRGGHGNCAASVSSNLVLYVPIVTFGGAYYAADLQYNSNNLTFTLSNANTVGDVSAYSNCTVSTLSAGGTLHVPVVMIGGVSYWADLLWNGSVFTVAAAGQN